MIDIDTENITNDEAKDLVSKLRQDITKYTYAYYIEDKPIVSDAEYDYLFDLLTSLEQKFPEFTSPDSPTNKVGITASEKFAKVEHKVPMLSLSNAFTSEDIIDFITRVKKFLNIDHFPFFFCEPKIDGLSFSALYENGKFKTGSTRGNGYIGEDITQNIKTIKDFPLQITDAPNVLEVRGEIYIGLTDFIKLNEQQKILGLAEFVNPRNAAAGSLRQLDAKITASRPLRYFIYSVGFVSDKIAPTQQLLLAKLIELGFNVNPTCTLATSQEEILKFYEELKSNRDKIDYEIDGAVYKLNDFADQQRMGFIARSPRFAIAHKFPAIIGVTKLLNITFQVGRTGVLTPVAILEPISIKGASITRATLHNIDQIAKQDIRINDYVQVGRAGDVIPKINGVDLNQRPPNAPKLTPPTHCPSCGSALHYSQEEVAVRCDNGLKCPAQNYERIYHFVSKSALNIDGLGRKQIQFFIEQGLISNPVDIFSIKEHKHLKDLGRWGEKSVGNLLANIEKARDVTLNRFIYALGIRHIGQTTAKVLAKEFISSSNFLEGMIKLTDQDEAIYSKLDNIEGIGEKILLALIDFFSIQENIEITSKLTQILNINDYIDNRVQSAISDKIIVFTGTLQALSRAEAKASAERFGAKVSSAVSGSTDIVVVGKNPGSKLKKAKELGIRVMSEEEWVEYILPISQKLDFKIRSEDRNVENYLRTGASEILKN